MNDSTVKGRRLLIVGRSLEWFTLSWNVAGVVVLTILVVASQSIALLGFGLDSLIEIGASVVVLWELSSMGPDRQRRALILIAIAFAALAVYLLAQSTVSLVEGHRAVPLVGGIAWTGVTAAVMFALAVGKSKVGRALGNKVLQTEGRVTLIDGVLATSVLIGLLAERIWGWWWADSIAAFVIVFYALRECLTIRRDLKTTAAR